MCQYFLACCNIFFQAAQKNMIVTFLKGQSPNEISMKILWIFKYAYSPKKLEKHPLLVSTLDNCGTNLRELSLFLDDHGSNLP